jgi:hypothetical protein
MSNELKDGLILEVFTIGGIEFRVWPYNPFQYWDIINLFNMEDRDSEWFFKLINASKNIKVSIGANGTERTIDRQFLMQNESMLSTDFVFELTSKILDYVNKTEAHLANIKKK